jgi:hypothetical protein
MTPTPGAQKVAAGGIPDQIKLPEAIWLTLGRIKIRKGFTFFVLKFEELALLLDFNVQR